MNVILYILTFFVLFFALTFIRYRLKSGRKITGDAIVKYRVIDIGRDDSFRYSFESLWGNKRVFLSQPINDLEWVYVDALDYKKLSPESPLKMVEENYSIRFEFEVSRLLFGGLGLGKIIRYEKIKETPVVLKS